MSLIMVLKAFYLTLLVRRVLLFLVWFLSALDQRPVSSDLTSDHILLLLATQPGHHHSGVGSKCLPSWSHHLPPVQDTSLALLQPAPAPAALPALAPGLTLIPALPHSQQPDRQEALLAPHLPASGPYAGQGQAGPGAVILQPAPGPLLLPGVEDTVGGQETEGGALGGLLQGEGRGGEERVVAGGAVEGE